MTDLEKINEKTKKILSMWEIAKEIESIENNDIVKPGEACILTNGMSLSCSVDGMVWYIRKTDGGKRLWKVIPKAKVDSGRIARDYLYTKWYVESEIENWF